MIVPPELYILFKKFEYWKENHNTIKIKTKMVLLSSDIHVIETGVPVVVVGDTSISTSISISTNENGGSINFSNRWRHYTLWFCIGCIWGAVNQFAMAGVTLLLLKHEVGISVWTSNLIVILFTIMNTSGSFVLRYMILRILSTVTVTTATSAARAKIDRDILYVMEEYISKSFVVFFLLGSMVSTK